MMDVETALEEGASGARMFDVQGHRGARGLLPENTIAGFLRALELGVNTLETDVVITRENEVVLSHDPWFSSDFSALPDGRRIPAHLQYAHRIFEMDYETVCTYDCGLPNRRFPGQTASRSVKPRLRDMIRAAEAFARDHGLQPVQYNIETKTSPAGDQILHPSPSDFVRSLIDVIEEEGIVDRTIVQSFDPRTLRVIRVQRIPVRTSLLISRGDFLGVPADVRLLGFRPDVYSPDYRLVDRTLLREAHERHMRVIPWTVNATGEMQRLRDLGVDGLITDYPDRARDALQGR